MAEQGLDHPDVDSLLDQQRRGGVPEPVRGQVWFDPEALGQGPQPFSERGRAEPTTFRVQEQGRRERALVATHLTMSPELLLQLAIWYKDDALLVAFAPDEDLASVMRDVADLYIGQLADPQSGHDEQLDDQDSDGNFRSRCRVILTWLRWHSDGAFVGVENRF